MALIEFIKSAGEKLFGKPAQAAQSSGNPAAANAAAGDAILAYIQSLKLSATALTVTFDGATATAKVYGVADDQATREKIVLAAGNVEGVARVEDNMTVARPAPQATYYTVVAGDTLSKIAKQHYGSANEYMRIFEANQPMLKDPNKIYPGQVLRIPPQA